MFYSSDIVFYSLYFSLAYFIVLFLGAPEHRMGVPQQMNDWLTNWLLETIGMFYKCLNAADDYQKPNH